MNPFALYTSPATAPATLDASTVLNSPSATSLAADGESAVVLAYQSKSPQPVTFALSANSTGLPVGSLGQFDPNYLANPNPATDNVQSYKVAAPTYGPDAGGNYLFLALLWGPNALPVPNVPTVNLSLTAMQQGGSGLAQASVALEPPPLLLVHGIWSSSQVWHSSGTSATQEGFWNWISALYPHNLTDVVNY